MAENKKDFFDYVKPFTSKLKPAVDWLTRSKFNILFLAVGVILAISIFLLLKDMIKNVFIISFLILLGGVSKIYQRYFKVQIGIEFIMLATVISGYVYGSFVGAIVGFFTFALATYFTGRFSHTLIISFILITLVGIAAPFFRNTSITVAGITLTLIYDIILIPVYIGWFRGRIPKIMLFAISHFVWNLWVFTTIAPYMLELLQ